MEEKETYKPSRNVQAAEAAAQAQQQKQPAYASRWEQQLGEALERILNQQDFRYNVNGDALYRQMQQQAARNGERAMQDAMGRAAAMTGGYASSYAQSVGQQAYQQELDGLADRIPELYALAMEQYRQRSQALQDRYALLAGAEDRDYSRYRDALSAWQKEADQLWSQYRDERDFDYGAYRDDIADWKWQTDFAESLRRYEQDWADKHPAVTPSYSYTAPVKKKEEEKKPASSTGPTLVML